MLTDFILFAVAGFVAAGLTVLGGFLTSTHKAARVTFVVGGVLLFVIVIIQGIRTYHAQAEADQVFMTYMQRISDERTASDRKIDSLFALLLPQTIPPKAERKPHSTAIPPTQKHLLPPAELAHLTVSQSRKISTRVDAPTQTEVIIQTDKVFPTLKLVLQCDKPLIEAEPVGVGIATMVGYGVVKEHPNVVVYSYESAVPPFGPAHPVVINVWSKEPVTCNQVATF